MRLFIVLAFVAIAQAAKFDNVKIKNTCTIDNQLVLNNTVSSNQIVFKNAVTHDSVTLSVSPAPGAVVHSVPALGQNSHFLMDNGAQIVNGQQTYTTPIILPQGATPLGYYEEYDAEITLQGALFGEGVSYPDFPNLNDTVTLNGTLEVPISLTRVGRQVTFVMHPWIVLSDCCQNTVFTNPGSIPAQFAPTASEESVSGAFRATLFGGQSPILGTVFGALQVNRDGSLMMSLPFYVTGGDGPEGEALEGPFSSGGSITGLASSATLSWSV